MQAISLIERAEQHEGGPVALARRLDVPQQHVTGWKNGSRTCPPDMRARMAEMVGADPVQELAEAIAEGLSEQRKAGLKATLERAGMAVASVTVTAIVGAALSVVPGSANALGTKGDGQHLHRAQVRHIVMH